MLVLTAGLVVVVLLAVAVMVDAAAAFLQRRALVSLADAAALAGAQAIDVAAYYREGASAATTLDPDGVPRRVRSILAQYGTDLPEGLVIEEARTDGRRVRIVLSAPLDLPFFEEWTGSRLEVVSEAELEYRPGVE